MSRLSRPPNYFASLYARNPDPWDFAASAYEREKYDATIAALCARRFDSVLEIGCSIGVLTARLAGHCNRLLAIDVVDSALDLARERCAPLSNVRFANFCMPRDWPRICDTFDLIVLSEVLYFLSPADIRRLAAQCHSGLAIGGDTLLVNYTEAIDEPCSGDEAAEIFITASQFARVGHVRHKRYRIDLLRRP
jgi:cyclopropane fatty-acyl-phospholipid synthase-like methyltransferase